MSSTGRTKKDGTKTKRRPQDFYVTPSFVTAAMLQRMDKPPFVLQKRMLEDVLEPAAGDGAIIRVLRQFYGQFRLTAVELNPARLTALRLARRAQRVVAGDFRAFANYQSDFLRRADKAGAPDEGYSLIMTNPPFTLSETFARKGLSILRPTGYQAMLLRLSFLESRERAPFHKAHPSDVYVLPKRPSYTSNGKTDSSSYAWFVWGPGCGNRWEVLDTPAMQLGEKWKFNGKD